jgi:MFS family permease
MTTVDPSRSIETAPIEDTSLLAFYRDMNLGERRTFWACATGWALDGMDFMIYPLVIGTIITLWKVDPGMAGLAGTVTLLSSAIGGWLGGYLADRIGRRHTIALSMFASAAAMLALSQADAYGPVLLLAFVAGLVSEARRPATLALLTDLVPSERRVTVFATLRVAENVAFAGGIALGGFLANHSFFWLFLGDAASSAVYGTIALTILPEGRRAGRQEERESGGTRAILADRAFVVFLAATVFLAFVYFQQQATLPLHVRRSGLSNAAFGLLLSLNGVLVMLFELPLSSFTMRRPAKQMMAVGFLLVGLGFGLTAAAHTMVALAATVAVWTLGEMIGAPVSYAYVSEIAPEHMRGRYQGLYGVTFGSGAIFGPALGTLLYAQGETGFWGLCGGLGLAAALLVLSGRPGRRTSGGTRQESPTTEAVLMTQPAPADEIIVLPQADVATSQDPFTP